MVVKIKGRHRKKRLYKKGSDAANIGKGKRGIVNVKAKVGRRNVNSKKTKGTGAKNSQSTVDGEEDMTNRRRSGRRVDFDVALVKVAGENDETVSESVTLGKRSREGKEIGSPAKIKSILKRPMVPVNTDADAIEAGADEPSVVPKVQPSRGRAVAGKEKAALSNIRTRDRARLLINKKEIRERRRKLRIQKRPHYALIIKAKSLWEKVRNRKIDDDTKSRLITELHSLVCGKAKEMIFAHDGVRVIQCLMAVKDEEIRTKLFEELKGDIVSMAKSKYARFFVIKMLKYGTNQQRTFIIEALAEDAPSLMKHSYASSVVEYGYNNYANALLRTHLYTPFYGNKLSCFKPETPCSLADIISQSDPAEIDTIMSSLKDHIVQLSSKISLRHTMVHHLILQFFLQNQKSHREEVIDALKERLVEIVHTRDGSRAAMHCVWHGSARQRKAIVHSMKTYVAKIATEEYGHLVLLAIFDVIDDTTMIGNRIIKELKHNMKDVADSKYGIRVLHYLLHPRNPAYFPPDVCRLLTEGDANLISKKPIEKRRAELLEAISSPLVEFISANIRNMIFKPLQALIILECIKNSTADCTPIFEAIAEVASDDFVPCNEDSYHIVEQSRSHFVLSKLLKLDVDNYKRGKATLSEAFCKLLEPAHFKSWISCNKGCFVLVGLLESDIQSVQEIIRSAIIPVMKRLQSYSFSGAEVLLKKLGDDRSKPKR